MNAYNLPPTFKVSYNLLIGQEFDSQQKYVLLHTGKTLGQVTRNIH